MTKINELDAKVITAQTEIERLDEQIKEINRQMTDLNDNKGFLNRKNRGRNSRIREEEASTI